jgi:hypothetical protein
MSWQFIELVGDDWDDLRWLEHDRLCSLPSGKHTKSYRKWPFIVNFPIKNGDFP